MADLAKIENLRVVRIIINNTLYLQTGICIFQKLQDILEIVNTLLQKGPNLTKATRKISTQIWLSSQKDRMIINQDSGEKGQMTNSVQTLSFVHS